jgi:tRNA-binding EMAP/Myf-like protein
LSKPSSLRALYFLVLLIIASCSGDTELPATRSEIIIRDKSFQGKVTLSKLKTRDGVRIVLTDEAGKRSDDLIFRYPYYQFDTADIDRDGKTEILVGLIKPTEFDPQERKRLFILRIDTGQLRPLWLGSRVCQELVDFKAIEDGRVRTLERTQNGNYAVGIYQWQDFGLILLEYAQNEKPYDDAIAFFHI